MPITLSAKDTRLLQEALTALLAPLAHGDVNQWREASLKACSALLGTDRGGSVLPFPGVPLIRMSDRSMDVAAADYLGYFWRFDRPLLSRRSELGIDVWYRDMLCDRREHLKSEKFHDWCVPHRLHQPVAMMQDVEASDIPAAFYFYREQERDDSFNERSVELLRLILPSFRAGVAVASRMASMRDALTTILETSSDGVALCSAAGRIVHENPSLAALLARDPESAKVRAMVAMAARLARASSRPTTRTGPDPALASSWASRTLRTAIGVYRVSASLARGPVLSGDDDVIVLVEALAPRAISDDLLRTRYRLTYREINVARQLALGASTAGVASQLGISIHTARRHTEQVLTKLGIHRRTQVASVLLGFVNPD